ncbi:sugar ABC transporter permease [Lachnospiraceae bacterium OttesenSCG-928-D06]|nr:sugar ABC transporter permease [Lachnospiraceae bacterium OttesenSCG-928-D06]
MKNKKYKNGQAYAFLSPFLLLVSIFYVLPAIITVAMAFTNLDASFVWNFVGIKNFQRIFMDPNTVVIVRNTVLFVLIAIAATVIIDLFFAIMTTYFIKDEKVSSLIKAVLMIPMITPAVVYSVLWIWLLEAGDSGVINKVYMFLTGNDAVNWIAKYPFAIILIATVLVSFAYGTTIFSSAIKSIPDNQFKAAKVDGASEWEIVTGIIIPNIRYHIQFITLWEALGLLTNYVTIMLITDGGPGIKTEVWALSAYHKAFRDQQYGYGAAISIVLIMVVMVLMLLVNRVLNKQSGR